MQATLKRISRNPAKNRTVVVNPINKRMIKLDLAMIECLLDGEPVECEDIVIIPADDLIKAHERAVSIRALRTPEPDFHL